jgi:hypothetical protein
LIDDQASDELKDFLLEVVCAYSCDQTMTVAEGEARKARQGKKPDTMTPIEAHSTQYPYIEAASNSSVPSGAMKRSLMTEFNVSGHYEIFSPVVLNLRTLIGKAAPVMSKETYQKDVSNYVASIPKVDKIR